MGGFTQNDPRGEYWLYAEGDLRVNVGRGATDGVAHFNTSDVHLESGGPLDSRTVARILAELMVMFGDLRSGYPQLVLHRDGRYDLSQEDIAFIDRDLSIIGFRLLSRRDDRDLTWTRRR